MPKKFKLSYIMIATSLLLTLALPLGAQAGVWIEGTALAWQSSSKDSAGVESSATRTLGSLTAGYAFLQGFYLGVEALQERDPSSGTYDWGWGPRGGFLFKGIELTASYLPYARSSVGVSERKGGGLAVHAGYTTSLGGALRVGLQALYWALSFDERDGSALITREKKTELAPQLVLALEF